ncbi:MAG: rhomboid family intramembrane serine protease [Pyrinomonadaceae bacterium]|nr:rhomboid family intramembrane serine protease [Pyrinomonadaceae bacterium]
MSIEHKDDELVVESTRADERDGTSSFSGPGIPVYSSLIIVGIICVAFGQISSGLKQSIAIASFDKHAFVAYGEYWRILTGSVMHNGVLHLTLNCLALYSIGKVIEWLSDKSIVPIVFLLSAIGGGLLSLLFKPDVPSVGASGGVVGLLGYLIVYAFVRRQFVSPAFRKDLLMNLGFIVVLGLVLYQWVDNFGHLGGLLTGVLFGFFQVPRDPYVDPTKPGKVSELAGIVSLGVILSVSLFSVLLLLRIV